MLLVLRAGWKFPLSVLSFLGEGSHKVVHFFFFGGGEEVGGSVGHRESAADLTVPVLTAGQTPGG